MRQLSRQYRFLLVLSTTLLLTACEPFEEPFYDPVIRGDAPASPGAAWQEEPIAVRKNFEITYPETDLTKTISLPQLMDMALYNNPQTKVSWNQARASAYAYRTSLSNYYPTISYSGSFGAQTTTGSSFASSGGGIITNNTTVKQSLTLLTNQLNLTFLLLDFGGRNATSDFAYQTLLSSNWQHDLAMQQVMLSLISAYVSYIGNKALTEAYEQNLKDSQVILDSASLMHSAGLATLSDVLLAQSNLELTKTNLIQAQGLTQTAIADILIAVGLPPDTCIDIEDLPDALPVIDIAGGICSLIDLAKERRPELGMAIAAIKQQEAQLAISYSSGMPTLTANANWQQVRFIAPRRPSGYSEVAFLQLNFPLFQGYYYLNQQRQLRAQVDAALANLDVQVAAISSEVVANYFLLKAAEGALPSSEAAVEYSNRAFKGFVVQYKTGTASITDLVSALTNLSTARSQQVLTRTQWASSLANLAFSVGVLEDTSGEWRKAPPKELTQIPIKDKER